MKQCIIFTARRCLQKACGTLLTPYPHPGSFVPVGSHGNTITLAHPDEPLFGSQGDTITLVHPYEPYMQKCGRFGEALVPRSESRLEDEALENPLLHLYLARSRLRKILKQKTANRE